MSEWEKVRLGDVCEILDNMRVPVTEKDRIHGIYPYYGANGIQDYVDDYIFDGEFVLVAEDGGNFGSKDKPIAYRVSGKCWVNNHAHILRATSKINIDYLCYSIMFYDVSKLINGTTRSKLNQASLKKIIIPLPPLSEQKKIADRLDKVSELIALRKKQAELLDTSVKARFIEMFGDPVTNPMGWDCKSFTDVCVSIYGGGTPSKNHPEYFRGNIPWVSPKDMKSIIIVNSIDHINETAIKNSSTKIVPKNSILMVIRSGILKHSLPVGMNIVPVTINQDMKAFIPNKKIKSTYLLYYFKAIEKDVLTKVRGVTADNIDFKDFLNRKISLPPLALQNEFAKYVTAVEKTKVPVIKSIETLETFKKSLMQEYFG